MPNEAEGDASKTEGGTKPAADDDFELVGEDTPLVAAGGDKSSDDKKAAGKSYGNVPVIKIDEQGSPDKVTTTEVTDEGVPPKNFGQIMQEIATNVGKGSAALGKTVGQKTKEITTNVGNETKKIAESARPHMTKFGENVGKSTRQLTEHVGKESQKLGENVGKTSRQLSENVGKTTRELSEHVGRESQKLGQKTREITDHVGRESMKIADAVGKETKVHYAKIAPHVEPHAKKYSSLVNGTAPNLATSDDDSLWKQLLDGTARAYGWVVFCDNSFTGAVIALAMLVSSPLSFLCSLYCAGLANYTATLIDLDLATMRRGHFASNAVLFGSGIATYFSYEGVWDWLTLILIATLGAPVVLLAYLFTARILTPMGTPTTLFPYVGVMVFALLGSQLWRSTALATIEIVEAERFHFFEAAFKGVAQIFIVNNGFSGLLIILGMLACSRILAAASFVGSILSALLGLAFFGIPVEFINAGLLGFNSALAGSALLFFFVPTWKSFVVGFLGVLMTLGAQVAFEGLFTPWSVPVMVFPFCFAMLPFVSLDLGTVSGADEPFMTVIPLADLTTPEEHLKRSRNEDYAEIPDVDEENGDVEAQEDEGKDTPANEEETKEEAGDDLNV